MRVNDLWDQYFEGNTASDIAKKYARVDKAVKTLRAVTPGVGVSVSEANVWEAESMDVFFGSENGAKLMNVKQTYDPDNILTNWGAVGFDAKDDRYRCYPKRPDAVGPTEL